MKEEDTPNESSEEPPAPPAPERPEPFQTEEIGKSLDDDKVEQRGD